MTVLKFLLKPIKFVVFLGMIAALIYFRSIIFHANVNQHIDTAVSYVEERFDLSIPAHAVAAVEIKTIVQSECEPAEVDVVNDNAVATVAVAEPEPSTDLSQADESMPSDQTTSLIDSVSEIVNVINEEAGKLFDVSDTELAADPVVENDVSDDKAMALVADDGDVADPVQAPAVQAPVQAPGQAPVQAAVSLPVDTKQILFKARQSFWDGDTHAAEELYLDLATLDNSDPDIYGELGNVYYTQGKWKQAGEAYYEAAVRLLAQKNDGRMVDRVSYLLRVIQGLDTESAEKLKDKISG